MRRGLFPGQEEAIRERLTELRSTNQRTRRRAFLGMIASGVAGAASATLVTAAAGSGRRRPAEDRPVPAEPAPELARQRSFATGPLDTLVARQAQLVTSVMLTETSADDPVWVGIARLIGACVDRHPAVEPGLAALLFQLSQRPHFPSHLHPWVKMLEQRPR